MLDIHNRRLPFGAIKAFCAEHGMSYPPCAKMLRDGRAVLNREGTKLVVVEVPPRGTPQAITPSFTIAPEPTWEGKCSAFQTLAERLIEDRPEGKSVDDACGDLCCQVRLALGTVMRESGEAS